MKKKKSLIIIALSIAIIGIVSFNVLAEGKDDGNNKTPLDFCLFASEDINVKSSDSSFYGDIKANESFYVDGDIFTLEGTLYSKTLTRGKFNNKFNVDKYVKSTEKMKMIEVIDDLESMALINGKIYQGDQVIDKIDTSKSIIVKNGGITGFGVISELNNYLIADKDIKININNASPLDKQDTTNRKPISIASKDGDITIDGSYTVMVGTIYAPNGKVTINSAYTYIVGNIIAKEININSAYLYMNDKNKIIFDKDL